MKKRITGDLKLTSVNIFEDRYRQFKQLNLDSKMTLQKLVNRSLELYLSDEEYRVLIDEMLDLQDSGSSF